MRDFGIKRILIPTDLSESGLIALRYARLFAEHFSAGLTMIYAEPIFSVGSGVIPMYVASTPEHLAAIERQMRAYAKESLAGLTYEATAVGGDPVPSIVVEAAERDVDLIVMATHGLRGWRRAVLGSVTEGVLRHGTCPVLSISRPQDGAALPAAVTRIVCPVNFTDVAREALDYAAHLARSFECELHVVHVVEESGATRAEVTEEDVRAWIDPSIQEPCTVRQLVLRGGPAERVLDCAEDVRADLLVVGALHKRFRDITTIGTTSERLVRFARMPVLTVPHSTATEAARASGKEESVVVTRG